MIALKRKSTAFDYSAEIELSAGMTEYVEIPKVSVNKKGVIDIGWQCDDGITLYGTLSEEYNSRETMWQEMADGQEANRTLRYIKLVNTSDTTGKAYIRVILC